MFFEEGGERCSIDSASAWCSIGRLHPYATVISAVFYGVIGGGVEVVPGEALGAIFIGDEPTEEARVRWGGKES